MKHISTVNMREVMDQIRERVNLRPVVIPDHEAFLQDLYASTREDLCAIVSDETQLRQLLAIQYNAQQTSYAAEFPDASHYIVLLDNEPVGRLILDRRPAANHGVDLAILHNYRNLGVGTVVLQRLFDESSARGVPFTFSVVKTNPAIRLYERLGCRIDGDMGTHFSMSWISNATQ